VTSQCWQTSACGTGSPLSWPGKRPFDFAAAAVLLVLLFPFLLLGLAVSAYDTGRPLFTQQRLGFGGRQFGCLKFRTMSLDADDLLARHLAGDPAASAEWESTRKLRLDPRVSRAGTFLRKTAIDELPQLINVLMGEMSLVGPRPVVTAEIVKYGTTWADYIRVRPGLTGLWQVSGRNDTTYEERVALDAIYVGNCTPALDLKILLLTIPALLSGRGAY
jgi:exopolysaccharide production protein ExoY